MGKTPLLPEKGIPMSHPSMAAEAKQLVKDALVSAARAALSSSDENMQTLQSAAAVDHDSPSSVDDLSQADSSRDLSTLFGETVADQRAGLQRIEQLDFGPKDRVEPGAIIGFGGRHYVVGVVSEAFDCGGVTYEGVSTESPIYAAIAGRREGETFAFRGQHERLDVVG